MTTKKKTYLFFALLIFWFALTGEMTLRQLALGVFACLLTLYLHDWLISHAKIKPISGMPKTNWPKLFIISIIAILQSAWHQILRIISGNEETIYLQIALDHDHPYVTAIIANVITLTPGAVSVEVDDNVLKILAYEPKSEKEHVALYELIDALQSSFGR